jgi:hypothetical protein
MEVKDACRFIYLPILVYFSSVYQVIPQHQKYHVIMPTLQRKLQAKVTQTVQSQNRNYLNMLQTIINRSVIMEKNDR